jgi:hypothetical protein
VGPPTGDFATLPAPKKFRKPPFRHAWEEALSSSTRTKFCPNDDCGSIGIDSTAWVFVPQSCAQQRNNGQKRRLI